MGAMATLEAHAERGAPAGARCLGLASQCLVGARAATGALASRGAEAAADKSAVFLHTKASVSRHLLYHGCLHLCCNEFKTWARPSAVTCIVARAVWQFAQSTSLKARNSLERHCVSDLLMADHAAAVSFSAGV